MRRTSARRNGSTPSASSANWRSPPATTRDMEPWEDSIALADAGGLLHSPWAWFTRAVALLIVGDREKCARGGRNMRRRRRRTRRTLLRRSGGGHGGWCPGRRRRARSERASRRRDMRRAQLITDPGMREHVLTSAALPYLNYRAEPDFDAAMSILAGHEDAVTVLRPVGIVWRDYASGLAHLGLGHTTTAIHHLTRAVRLADRIGFSVGMDQFVVALAIAHGQAGGLALCGTLAGYARQHCAADDGADPHLVRPPPRRTGRPAGRRRVETGHRRRRATRPQKLHPPHRTRRAGPPRQHRPGVNLSRSSGIGGCRGHRDQRCASLRG